jgi:glycerol-3-phosphate cytidylyltransferase
MDNMSNEQHILAAKEKLHSFYNRVILKKSIITSYYRMFAIFQSVLDQHGIEFFAHSGTMLGCVRHRGIIPWDDDVDVMIEESLEQKLLAVVPELEEKGIKLKSNEHSGLHQFYCASKEICPLDVYMQIDVFIGKRMEIEGDLCLHYKSEDFRTWFAKRYIRLQDLYPLKIYDFGPLKVKGIGDYRNYFAKSGFALDEAIVARHMNFQHFLPEIEELKTLGVYPIRDQSLLHQRHEITLEEVGNYAQERESSASSKKTVLTYGTFDLFHVGHVRILKRLRELGDRLIVGVSSDEFNAIKGKKSFYSYEERAEILLATEFVDEVFPENTWDQKRTDVKRFGANIFGMGSDWHGKFDELNDLCEVVYLDRTEDISTTDIKKALSNINFNEIVGLEKTLHSALDIVINLASSVGRR